ncbi:unnamed protein product [Gadus morhua 'NCC']
MQRLKNVLVTGCLCKLVPIRVVTLLSPCLPAVRSLSAHKARSVVRGTVFRRGGACFVSSAPECPSVSRAGIVEAMLGYSVLKLTRRAPASLVYPTEYRVQRRGD